MYNYYLAIDFGNRIVKVETVFDSEEEANYFADTIAEFIVEFSFVQMIDKFTPPF